VETTQYVQRNMVGSQREGRNCFLQDTLHEYSGGEEIMWWSAKNRLERMKAKWPKARNPAVQTKMERLQAKIDAEGSQ